MLRRPQRITLCPHSTLFRSVTANTQQELGGLFEGKNDIREVFFPGNINPIKADLVQSSPTHDAALVKIHLPDATPKVELNDNYGEIKQGDRKSTRLNSSHANISYAVFCLKKKKNLLRFFVLA